MSKWLVEDRYYTFTLPPLRVRTLKPPEFVHILCPPQTIDESVRRDPGAAYNPFRNVGGQRTSAVVAGTNTKSSKAHRNFKWLPWYPGDISETVFDLDVITGPMTGCVLAQYVRDGKNVVGHIGTLDVDVPGHGSTVNTLVKERWNTFAKDHPGDIVGAFNPVDKKIPAAPPARGEDAGGQVWGLLTTSGEYYTIYVQNQRPPGQQVNYSEWRVTAVHAAIRMTRAEWEKI